MSQVKTDGKDRQTAQQFIPKNNPEKSPADASLPKDDTSPTQLKSA